MGEKLVDFAKIKAKVSITQVLELLGIELKGKGDKLEGACPLCSESGSSSTRFKVTPSRNAWRCFQCKEGGNQLDLVAKMQDTDTKGAALFIAESLGIEDCYYQSKRNKPQQRKEEGSSEQPSVESPSAIDFEIRAANKPLSFDGLKLDYDDDTLLEVGLDRRTLSTFGVGVPHGGMMKDRIAIPVRNADDELIAYCGYGHLDQLPKWPGEKHYTGGVDVFNIDYVRQEMLDQVYLVRDPLDVLWLHQLGIDNVVALAGNEEMRMQQLALLIEERVEQIMFLCHLSVTELLVAAYASRELYIRSFELPDGCPFVRSCTHDTLEAILGSLTKVAA